MFKIFGPNSSHIILFGQSQLPQFCNFLFFCAKKTLILKALYLDED